MIKRFVAVLVLLALLPAAAQAWWNADWKNRRKITLVTTPEGADIKEAVGPIPVALRLHSGNFLFGDAKVDGSDIRFVASDDKTPLKSAVEVYDSANQIAIIWVQVPRISPASSADFFWLYSGNDKVGSADDPKGIFDSAQILALHFGEAQGDFKDTSTYANPVSGDGVAYDPSGLTGGAARFSGKPLRVDTVASLKIPAAGSVTFSAWVRPSAPQSAQLFQWGPLLLDLADGKAQATLERVKVSGGELKAGDWTHVAVAVSDKLVLYVNGKEVASEAVHVPEIAGPMLLGKGFDGWLDTVAVASAARSAAWIGVEASQGVESKLMVAGEPETTEGGDEHGYIAILAGSLTPDAKVVIVILAGMFLIAVWVMGNKAVQVVRTDKHNTFFLETFEKRAREFLNPDSDMAKSTGNNAELRHSSIARLYATGIRELRQRVGAQHGGLSAESVAAIKASIDSTLIRENQRLNRLMVLLTIAISGGPFLGLLGTVVGVMITFAAIAAQGDVNINAIAPGIAAALLATVAGLSVAIPSLFGYNYLITRIKAITADMQAFTDEFIAKMAEAHNR